MLFHRRPLNKFSSLLRVISETYQWTWKHLPLMLRSTGLNTFGMTNTIYRDLLCPANGGGRGNLSIEEVEHRGDQVAKHVYGLSILAI